MILQEQVAVVTGGSRGIGRAIAQLLAEQGATVIATARSTDPINAWTAETPSTEGRVDAVALNVTDRPAIDAFIEQVIERHGKVDILVNNAGITRDGLLMAMEDEQFDEVLTTNLTGAFWLTRAVSRNMLRARRGRIINITSVSGMMGNPGQVNYSAAKAGMIGMTKAVAKEVAKRGITCNAVARASSPPT